MTLPFPGELPSTGRGVGVDRSVVSALLELSYADRGDWASTLQHILHIDARVVDVERVSYWRMRDETRSMVCEMAYQRTTGAFERGFVLAREAHPAYFAAVDQGPVEIRDARADPIVASLREYLEARAIWSLLDFPIVVRGRIVGILCHEHVGAPRSWSVSDEQFAATVAQVVASSLAGQERQRAEEAASRAAFLDRTSQSLGETLAVDEVARRAVALAVPHTADGSMLQLLDGDVLRPAAMAHVTLEGRATMEHAIRSPPAWLAAPFLPARVIAQRDSVLIPQVTDEALAYFGIGAAGLPVAHSLGVRSVMAVPLLDGPRILGSLTVFAGTRRYGNDDLQLIEEFAARVAAAIVNARHHERAQNAVRARDEFIALAAHELHTPVAAMQLTAEGLVRRFATASREDVAQAMQRVVSQTKRLTRLIEQMLDGAMIGADRLSLRLEQVDLVQVARDVADMFEPRLELARSELKMRVGPPVIAQWDRLRLEQMLTGLLDNAVKFGSRKPIELTVASDGGTATLTVSDHGPGIAADRLEHIFDAFERAVSPRHYGGLGLGLFIARAIARAHGGDLTVESRLGEGATFRVRLPIRLLGESSPRG